VKFIPWVALLCATSCQAEVIGLAPPWEVKGTYYVFDDCTVQYAGANIYSVNCHPGFFKFNEPAFAALKGPKVLMSLNGSKPFETTINKTGLLPNGERYYAVSMD
jgi:hypothetical protein